MSGPHEHPISVQEYRYPLRSVLMEYVYTAIGLLFTLGPLVVTQPLPAVTGILAALAALFLAFGVRTFIRHNIVVRITDNGIETAGLVRRRIAWDELEECKLSYYSTRRDKEAGWMQLRLKGNMSLRLDSNINGFREITERALRAAREGELPIDFGTCENLAALGLARREGSNGGPGPA